MDYIDFIMERLTHAPSLPYPVNRSIMETGDGVTIKEKNGPIGIVETSNLRMKEIVERFEKKKKEEAKEKSKKKTDKKGGIERPAFDTGGPVGSSFGNFDPEKFKGNDFLEKLAKRVRYAGEHGEANEDFLGKVGREVNEKIELSDDWRNSFKAYLNEFVVDENISEAFGVSRELARDVEAIVRERKERGLTAEEIEASRATLESALGRELTPDELARALKEQESSGRGKGTEVFNSQMKMIEEAVSNPEKHKEVLKTISEQSPEALKKALSGAGGKLVIGVLLGDIVDREKYFKALDEVLKKDPEDLKQSLKDLVEKIRQEEIDLKPKVDPERQKLALAQAEDWIKDQKKKRQVSAEEVDEIMAGIERGGVLMMGGSDPVEDAANLMEKIDLISNEPGEGFIRVRNELVDSDLVNVIAEEIYGVDLPKIQAEKNRFSELKDIDDPAVFKQRYKSLLSDLLERADAAASAPEREEERAQAQRDGDELATTGEKTRGGKTFNIKGLEEIVGEELWRREPRNIQEVAAWIMAGDDRSIWGPDGVYPIFSLGDEKDSEGKRKAEFHEQNLIRWLRSKALEHHGDNPNDPIQLLQSINIETLFKQISILTMKYNKQKYFQDENGKPLSNLADEVINEAWHFGFKRNRNLGYIQAMNSDEKLFEGMVEMNGKNENTTGTNLMKHMQMGEDFDNDKGNKDNMVGDALLAANQIYRNLADIVRLHQILPEDLPIFTFDGFIETSRFLNNQDFSEDTKGYGNLIIEDEKIYYRDPRTGVHTDIFINKKLFSGENLVKFLNIFPAASPEETNESFTRELVKQSIAKIVGFDAGMDRKKFEKFIEDHGTISEDEYKKGGDEYKKALADYRKIVRINLEWAETNSWVEQRWNGVAARNDTGYRGYDAWTKMNAQYYRERQSGPRTAGPIGNPHDLQIFKMLSPDMWLAIRTESGKAVQEVFDEIHMINLQLYKYKDNLTPEQEIEKEELLKSKKDAHNSLRFPRWTETDWASNGLKRQSEVWHDILNTEDFKFNEIVKRDTWGILRYDRQKFEEVVKDGFIKKRRYALSSNNAMNYGAITRSRVRTKIFDEKGNLLENPEFKFIDEYLAEAMFGGIVMDSITQDWFEGRLEFKAADEQGVREVKDKDNATFGDYLNSVEARDKILKNVSRAGIAAQIKAHREHSGTTERWSSEVIRKFLQSLHSMPQYIEDPETGKEIELKDSQFFSEEDIEWIRKETNTGKGMLLWEDTYHIGWDAAAEAVPEIFKMFFKDVFAA